MVMTGLLMMFKLKNDSSENEPERVTYCYWILVFWMAGLFIQLFLSLSSEIFVQSLLIISGTKKVLVEKDFNFVRAYSDKKRSDIRNHRNSDNNNK